MPYSICSDLRPPSPIPSPTHGRLPLVRTSCSPPTSRPRSASTASSISLCSGKTEGKEHPGPRTRTQEDWYRWPAPTKAHERNRVPLAVLALDVGVRGRDARRRNRRERRDFKMLGEWRVGESLGRGTSGQVRLARSTQTGEFAAIKKVRRLPDAHRDAKSVHREISLMKLVAPHPHVVELFDVFETEQHLYLISEYCPMGELFNYVIKHPLSQWEIRKFFVQLISALVHLSHFSIAHRDIKFENLLLYEDERGELSVKLADMGMATFQPEEALLETSCGSPHYAAPEVIAGEHYDGSLADVWSSGVVLYTLHARRLPFDDENIPALLRKIKTGEYEMPYSFPEEVRDLVGRCLRKDIKERIRLDQIPHHPYLEHGPSPLSPSALAPPMPAVMKAPKEREDFDEELLASLAVLLKVESGEVAAGMVLKNKANARLFYSILLGFRQPRQLRKEETELEHQLSRCDLDVSPSQRSFTSLPKSFSLPSFPNPSLAGVKASPPPAVTVRSTTVAERRHSLTHRKTTTGIHTDPAGLDSQTGDLRRLRHPGLHTSAPPLTPLPPLPGHNDVVFSAPPHIATFAFEPLPLLSPTVAPPRSIHLARGRSFSTRRSRSSGSIRDTSVTSLGPLRHSIDASSIADNSLAPRRKISMQQRIRNLFQSQAPKRTITSTSTSSSTSGANKDNAVAMSRRPPSPSPSTTSSMLKRSNGYRSLGRALLGKDPRSPNLDTLAEFGELLAQGAPPSRKASQADLPIRDVSRSGEGAKEGQAGRRTHSRRFSRGMQFFHDPTGTTEFASRVTAVQPHFIAKRRPPPLSIDSSNSVSVAATRPPLVHKPSLLGLGLPPLISKPRRLSLLGKAFPTKDAQPSVAVDTACSARPLSIHVVDDPEDPSNLLSALQQYPYRSSSDRTRTSSAPSTATTSHRMTTTTPTASPLSQHPSRFAPAALDSPSTSIPSPLAPRTTDPDPGPGPDADPTLTLASCPSPSLSLSLSISQHRTLAALALESRKLRLENRLLRAALSDKDDELALLRARERRMTSCLAWELEAGEHEHEHEHVRGREDRDDPVGRITDLQRLSWNGAGSGSARGLSAAVSGSGSGSGSASWVIEDDEDSEVEEAGEAREANKTRTLTRRQEMEWLDGLRRLSLSPGESVTGAQGSSLSFT
ncbi:hypothetical protein JCM1841_005582 [Sporobolomyces salmonicolor]